MASSKPFRAVLWGAFFVALGAGLWWIAAQTARFSAKKWDATMETAVKHALTSVGVADSDVLSSIHEIQRDKKGEWVLHRLSLAMKDPSTVKTMIEQLDSSGATVSRTDRDGKAMLIVKHGSRVYQEIEVQFR